MLRILPDVFTRNRVYVVDDQQNKLFYGTIYSAYKFIRHIEGRDSNGRKEACRKLVMVSDEGQSDVPPGGR